LQASITLAFRSSFSELPALSDEGKCRNQNSEILNIKNLLKLWSSVLHE
jgi:hypothetical protein